MTVNQASGYRFLKETYPCSNENKYFWKMPVKHGQYILINTFVLCACDFIFLVIATMSYVYTGSVHVHWECLLWEYMYQALFLAESTKCVFIYAVLKLFK